jgi:hypothetical protein
VKTTKTKIKRARKNLKPIQDGRHHFRLVVDVEVGQGDPEPEVLVQLLQVLQRLQDPRQLEQARPGADFMNRFWPKFTDKTFEKGQMLIYKYYGFLLFEAIKARNCVHYC